jgi:phospholipid/cholesterol/gamma-HCH transport system substrate-binding protein
LSRADKVVDVLHSSAEETFDEARTLLSEKIAGILEQVSLAATQTNAAIADLQTRSGATLDGFSQTADLLNARLSELETSLQEANTAFLAVTQASESFDALVEGDGALLIAEARVVLGDAKAAMATISTAIENDVPAIMADIRTGVATANTAVEDVATNLVGLTERLEPMAEDTQQAITSANGFFTQA